MEIILGILKPINKCIGQLEQKDKSLGEAFADILDFAKELFTDTNVSNALIAARESFVWYFNSKKLGEFEFGLYLAAYILDPRYRARYITEHGREVALLTIVKVGQMSDIPYDILESTVINRDFDNYLDAKSHYGAVGNKTALQYWKQRSYSGPLASIAIRLSSLKATSANIERAFSSLRYIQGQRRSAISKTTFMHMGRIKLTLQKRSDVEEDPIFDEFSDEVDEVILEEPTDKTGDSDIESCDIEDSCLSDFDTSNITQSSLVDLPDWIHDLTTKTCYDNFCKHIDFDLISNCNIRRDEISEFATDDQIRARIKRRSLPVEDCVQSDVIIDSASQISRLGPLDD